jgi:protocatechuate 3,4-dioxygenase beta subunit
MTSVQEAIMQMDEPGLARDLATLMRQARERRRALRWLAGTALLPLAARAATGGVVDAPAGAPCSATPELTRGPFPGDGTNHNAQGLANALALSGIVRSDIRSSIAGARGTAGGIPLAVRLQLVGAGAGCARRAGYAIYIWHCTRDGQYSMYSRPVAGENFLRGVQATDSSGVARFTTVFPGCYPGRMPHIHMEVYPGLDAITSPSRQVLTSQLALPRPPCDAVYATGGYGDSASNFAGLSFAADGVFRGRVDHLLADVSGDPARGYEATLQIAIGD